MAKSNTQICAACGGRLDAPVQGGKVNCAYCGTINIVEAQETKQGNEVLCPACGASNPKDAQHCGRCGIKLEFTCPKCNALNKYGAIYCVKCGVDIQGAIERQQDEIKRQQAEELQKQELTRQQTAKAKHKKRITSLVVSGAMLAIIFCIAVVGAGWIYTTNYSPAAQSTKTAIAIGETATARYSILFQDDFSDTNSGWDKTYNDNGSTDYENGGYRINVITTNQYFFANPYKSFQNDVRVEVDATKIGGQDDNAFGVICRYQDVDNFYYFYISSDGYIGIGVDNAGSRSIISSSDGNMTSNSRINQGAATNHIRADCIESTLKLFVNGTQVATATDSTFTGGDVGLIARTFSVSGTDILFNNFYVFKP